MTVGLRRHIGAADLRRKCLRKMLSEAAKQGQNFNRLTGGVVHVRLQRVPGGLQVNERPMIAGTNRQQVVAARTQTELIWLLHPMEGLDRIKDDPPGLRAQQRGSV